MKLQLPYHYLSITLMRDKCQVSWNQRKMPLNVEKKKPKMVSGKKKEPRSTALAL